MILYRLSFDLSLVFLRRNLWGGTEAPYRSRVQMNGASAALDQSGAPVPVVSQGGCRPALRGNSPPLLMLWRCCLCSVSSSPVPVPLPIMRA